MWKRISHMQTHWLLLKLGPESWLYFATGRCCCCCYHRRRRYFYTFQERALKPTNAFENKLKVSNHLHSPVQNKIKAGDGSVDRHFNEVSSPRRPKQRHTVRDWLFPVGSPLRAQGWWSPQNSLLALTRDVCLCENLWQRTEMTALWLTPTLCLFRKVLEIVFHQPHSLSTHNYLA